MNDPHERVLVVDDSARDRKLLRASLEREGFHVQEARDGVEALDLLRQTPADSVVSDILMPRLDGYRLCSEVRKDPALRHVRFVMHTSSYTSPADEQLAYRFGVDAFLKKPAPGEDIAAALRAPRRERPADGPEREIEQLTRMSQYSDALVRKLDQKNRELEQTTARLAAINSELERANAELERRVHERTAQLEIANRELEQFSEAVAHDLRAPVRAIAAYGAALSAECCDVLNERCKMMLERIPAAAQKMEHIIAELLNLSRVGRSELQMRDIDLSAMAEEVVTELRERDPARHVDVQIQPGLHARADAALLRIALENLLNNAWKFTSRAQNARIEVGRETDGRFFVRDNGAGFAPEQAARLFEPFVRLHDAGKFPGTGIGLATVRRVLNRHGGAVGANGAPNRGAYFWFSLPGGTPSAS